MKVIQKVYQSLNSHIIPIKLISETALKTIRVSKNTFYDLEKRFFHASSLLLIKNIGIDNEDSPGKYEIQKKRPVVQIGASEDKRELLVMPLSSQKLQYSKVLISSDFKTNLTI